MHPESGLIIDILSQIAKERRKRLWRIKRLLWIKKDPVINGQFWEILDETLPGHGFTYLGRCAECGSWELI
jgi:hypothetical protein